MADAFDERLYLLVDAEASERERRRLTNRLRRAELKQSASIEDIDHQIDPSRVAIRRYTQKIL